ncbi:MAG TPA: flagellar biosynthetic protein FliO [Bacillota bacterium]|nr:flagellar biosynthetic protein FliO [Bacillota bacterium]
MKKSCRVCGLGFLLVIVGFFLLPAITFAETTSDPGPEFNSSQWIWALFSLIIVVALAYWATKFFAGKFGISHAKHLKVAESLFLGPNRHLYLLLVHNKVLLIGSAEHGLSLLQEIDDPDFFNELEKTADSAQIIPNSKFAGMIGTFLNGLNPKGGIEVNSQTSKQRLQEGLERIRTWKSRGRKN